MDICNNDNSYKSIIVDINNSYWLDNITNSNEIIIDDKDFYIYGEKYNCFKQIWVIDKKNNKLNNTKYLILRDYINRKTNINWLEWNKLIELIEKLKKSYNNNKELILKIRKLWFKEPESKYRFYCFENLDMWSIITHNWKTLYNELVKIIKNNNKNDFKIIKLDKRKLKKWLRAEDLMFLLDWVILKVYFKKDSSKYLDIHLSEFNFLYKSGKPKKIVNFFKTIMANQNIETSENNRQSKKTINNKIKELLLLNDDIIIAKNWQYKLVPYIKQDRERITSDDVLWHPWRYIQYNENYIDEYYLN